MATAGAAFLVVLAALVFGPATSARAQGPSEAPPPWFADMDADKDGSIARAEYITHRMKLFDQLDADKDGVLTLDEFLKLAEPPHSQDGPNVPSLDQRRKALQGQYQQIDLDRDAKLTRPEVQAFVALAFNQIDCDGDGALSAVEVVQGCRRAGPAGPAGPAAPVARPAGPDRNGDGFVDLEEFLEFESANALQLDTNKDGKISLEEYLAIAGSATQNPPGAPPYAERRRIAQQRFRDIDKNKDGTIDVGELRLALTPGFKRVDRNGDGKVDPKEWAEAYNPPSPPPPPPAPKAAPPPQARPAAPPAGAPPQAKPGQPPAGKPGGGAPSGLPQGTLLPGTGPSR
ncbi:MAG: EF-hand domain-containing protein [Rhodospirillales bacterium]|nr:MAG: EF-hand domain-containing protein [Rhodospirillales bacterium]